MASLSNCATSTPTLLNILRSTTNCKKAGGIKAVYAIAQTGLDLATMATAANFSTTGSAGCGSLTNFVTTGGALFKTIEPDGADTTFTSERQDNGNYLNTITMYFKGTSCDRWCALSALKNTCPLVMAIQFADCTKIVAGLEASINGTAVTLSGSANPIEVSADSITAGTTDGDASSQTISFSWTTTNYPLCFTTSTIPT